MSLRPSDKKIIKGLARANVEQTLSSLRPFIDQAQWLAKSNRYSRNTIGKIERELKSHTRALVNPKHLAKYIAASCLLHCSDGWSYLGKALLSLLRGDPHKVRHLAYYAELRATMSLLASEGIGIFNRKHFVIDGPSSVSRLSSSIGTHDFVWDCLDHWSRLPNSGELFSNVVRPHQIALGDWFAPLGGIKALSPQAQTWFREWGMDLRMPASDHHARNQSSYRPDGIPEAWCLSASEALSVAAEFWEVFGFSSDRLFSVVDNHLLRFAIEAAFKGQTGLEPSGNLEKFSRFITALVSDLDFEPAVAEHWSAFLRREKVPTDPALFGLSALKPTDKFHGHVAILSRAALLLRLAGGSCSRLSSAAGITPERLQFWWDSVGPARGLWEGTKTADELIDVWSDISSLLEDVEEYRQRTPVPSQTFHRMGRELPHVVTGLCGCERFAIWGAIS